MSLIGKTIARVDGEVLFFTDGTAYEAGEYGGEYLDWAAVQERSHEAQGAREAARMRALEAMLHPRDKQWLRRRRREAEERRRAKMGAFERCLTEEMDATMKAYVADMRRTLDGPSLLFEPARLKRKHRPIKTYEPGKTYRRKDGSVFHCSGTITIPIKKRDA